jgi:hypothetical protein
VQKIKIKKYSGIQRHNPRNKFRENRSAGSEAVTGDTDTHRIVISYASLFHSRKESTLKFKITWNIRTAIGMAVISGRHGL